MKKSIFSHIAPIAVLIIVVSALAVSTPRHRTPSQNLADSTAAGSNPLAEPQVKSTPDPREDIAPPITAKNVKVKTIRGTSGPEIPFVGKISPKNIVRTNKLSRQTEKEEKQFSEKFLRKMKKKENLKRQIVQQRPSTSSKEGDEGAEARASFDIGGDAGDPPDNAVAVSENGFIVSADNGKINFFKTDGTQLDSLTYPDFLSALSTADEDTGDPKVIYDTEDARFIFCIQFADRTKVALAFSTAEDPREDWNLYLRETRPDNDGLHFDYPSLSVNYHEVFLSGNIFDDNSRVGNMIMAIDKDDGYAGRGLTWQRWDDLTPDWSWESVGQMFGVRAARASYYGPGHYFVSTKYSGGHELYLFHITDHLFNDPVLKKYTIDIGPYDPPANAFQPDTDERLDIADCRITGAYYQNRKIYFVFTKDDGHAFGGIAFYRLRLSSLNYKRWFFHDDQNSDYTYANLANRGEYEDYSRAVIVYLRSGKHTFPQIRMRLFNASMEPVRRSSTIKRGEHFRENNKSAPARWGDYIGIQREFGTQRAWVTGHIANASHEWRSRLISIDLPR
jgi:hypothetical protein